MSNLLLFDRFYSLLVGLFAPDQWAKIMTFFNFLVSLKLVKVCPWLCVCVEAKRLRHLAMNCGKVYLRRFLSRLESSVTKFSAKQDTTPKRFSFHQTLWKVNLVTTQWWDLQTGVTYSASNWHKKFRWKSNFEILKNYSITSRRWNAQSAPLLRLILQRIKHYDWLLFLDLNLEILFVDTNLEIHTNSTIFCASPALWFSVNFLHIFCHFCASPAIISFVKCTQIQPYFVLHQHDRMMVYCKILTQTSRIFFFARIILFNLCLSVKFSHKENNILPINEVDTRFKKLEFEGYNLGRGP